MQHNYADYTNYYHYMGEPFLIGRCLTMHYANYIKYDIVIILSIFIKHNNDNYARVSGTKWGVSIYANNHNCDIVNIVVA